MSDLIIPYTTSLEPFGFEYEPDDDLRIYSPFKEVPEGIDVHSGDKAAWVGPFITNDPGCYAYHAAWFPGRGIVQTAPLDLRVWHGGKGNDWFGLGLSGPSTQNPRSDAEVAELIRFCTTLRVLFAPRLRWWCRHSDYDPKKTDPGPGVTEEIMARAGLQWRCPF